MTSDVMKRIGGALGEAHGGARAAVRPTPNAPSRFWIITFLLVLFGLSTLKLR